jgi:hypothetical protein
MARGVTQGHENVRWDSEGVVLSQVSESRPGAPMLVLLNEFSGQILPLRDAQGQDDSVCG